MKSLFCLILIILNVCCQIVSATPFPIDKILVPIQLFDNYDEQYKESEQLKILNKITNGPLRNIKQLLFRASLLRESGDFVKGIDLTEEALLRSELAGYPEWASFSSILLSSSYRQVGIETEAKYYLKKSKSYLNQINNEKSKILASIYTVLEDAIQSYDEGAYKESINLLSEASKLIDHNKAIMEPYYYIFNLLLSQLNGTVYLGQQNYVLSKKYYQQCINLIDGSNDLINPYAYNGLLNIYKQLAQKDSAVYYQKLIEPYLVNMDDQHFKKEYYKIMGEFFEQEDLLTIANEYLKKEQYFTQKIWNRNQKIYNTILLGVKNEFQQTKKRYVIIFWTMLIIIPIVSLFVIEKARARKSNNASNTNFKRFEDPNVLFVDNQTLETERVVIQENDLNISQETEARLYKQLIKLENEQFYLDKTISLTKLSNQLFTNSTYLSFIIKKYRNQNFSDYIMNQRIQFLIQSLKENKDLLEFKLSYLADYAGFLSHSKFTTAFKSIVGKTPSQYIDDIRKER